MSPPLIDAWRTAAPKRHFAGRTGAVPSRPEDLAALADALLSPPPAETPAVMADAADPRVPRAACPPVPAEQITGGQAARGTPAPSIDLYLMIPAGLDGPDRRRAALAAAAHLAPQGRSAALFLFEGGRADAHILGNLGCGRNGPEGCIASADPGRTVAELVAQCDQVAVISLDGPRDALRRLGPLAARTVFVAGADPEGLVEAYRSLKSWRADGPSSEAALFIVGADGPDEAGQLHRRLARVARQCLGVELGNGGFLPALAADVRGQASVAPPPILQETPAEEVWPRLVSAARLRRTETALVMPAPPPTAVPQAAPAPADGYRVFVPWHPESHEALLAAIEVQGPALLADSLQQIFRVEVDEPGAPPLAAVRADGALVAILVPGPGETADAPAASRWLAVHRKVLARAYPCSGIREDVDPSAIVLAPVAAPAAADGIRRFVPVRMGGHLGVVLVP